MAYKQLSRTQHIDPGLLAAVKGAVRPAGPPGSQVAPPTGVPPGPPPSSTPSGTAGPMGAAIRPPSVATSQPSPAPTPPAPSTPTPSRADIPSAPTPTSSSGPATPAPSGAESRPGTAPPPNGEVKTESTEESSATKEKEPNTVRTLQQTAADQMFGDRTPIKFENNGDQTPERAADGMYL